MKQKIVTIGVGEELQASLVNGVDRRSVGILSLPSGAAVCALHLTLRIDLLVVVLPLPDMTFDELVESLSASRPPRMVAIVGEDDYSSLSRDELDWLTLLSAGLPEAELGALCSEFVRSSPRTGQRIMARLEVEIGGINRIRMVQTHDISATGMKVATSELLPPGTWVKLTFSWPGDPDPITSDAEVVRHTSRETEGLEGMGIRFTAFEGTGGRRLREHIRQRVDWQEPD